MPPTAARISVDHSRAVDAVRRLGEHREWHGGIRLDDFHSDGEPAFIECNPRISEPGNAARAGVNLPTLLADLATGAPLPERARITRAAGGAVSDYSITPETIRTVTHGA